MRKLAVVEKVAVGEGNGIGTLNEGPLHQALKRHYQRAGDEIEATVGGYVVDILRSGSVLEVHTGGFSGLKKKLRTLLDKHPVRLICPIAQERWLVKLPPQSSGDIVRRKSPKRSGYEAVFAKLVSIPDLLAHPHFELEVVLTREEEIRVFDGKRGRRRKGWVVTERRLLEVIEGHLLRTPADLQHLLPSQLPERFRTADIAEALSCQRRLAQQAAYCLRKAGVASIVGKEGNALVYCFDSP